MNTNSLISYSLAIKSLKYEYQRSNTGTIVSIRGEKRSAKRYEENLEVAEKAAIRQGWLKGLFTGLLWGIMFSLFGLGFWFGAQLIIWSTDDAIEKYPPPTGLMNATVNGTGPYAA